MFDSAIGWILAVAALAFGGIGWYISTTGMAGFGDAMMWFLCAAVLGILAIGIVLDEARVFKDASLRRTEFALSWLLMLGALAMGVVGFVLGFVFADAASLIWLWSGIILAVVSMGIMADEGRRLRAADHAVVDEIVGGLLSLAAIGIGVAGFIFGLMGQPHATAWLQAGVICSLSATAFMFDGERRAAAAAVRRMGAPDVNTAQSRAFMG
jgi:hypothetical protein